LGNGARVGVDRDEVLAITDLLGPGGQNRVLRADGGGDVVPRETPGPQRVRVEVPLHLPLHAAVRVGPGGTLHPTETPPHDVVPEVEELRFGEFLAGERELQDGYRGGVVGEDEGRRGAGGCRAEIRLRDAGDLRVGELFVDVRLEEVLHHRKAGE